MAWETTKHVKVIEPLSSSLDFVKFNFDEVVRDDHVCVVVTRNHKVEINRLLLFGLMFWSRATLFGLRLKQHWLLLT